MTLDAEDHANMSFERQNEASFPTLKIKLFAVRLFFIQERLLIYAKAAAVFRNENDTDADDDDVKKRRFEMKTFLTQRGGQPEVKLSLLFLQSTRPVPSHWPSLSLSLSFSLFLSFYLSFL